MPDVKGKSTSVGFIQASPNWKGDVKDRLQIMPSFALGESSVAEEEDDGSETYLANR